MGDVISLTRVTDVDIFSEFDAQCPSIPESIDLAIPRSAGKAIGKAEAGAEKKGYRTHSFLLIALSLLVLFTVKLIVGAMPSQSVDLTSTNTSYRQSQETWLSFIETLESDPLHQRVLEEKRLFANEHQ